MYRPLCCLGIFLSLVLISLTNAMAQNVPVMLEVDRTRLAEMFRLGDQLGERIWAGWSKAPFAVILVTDDVEFLIRHPAPSKDFIKLGYDKVLKSDVYWRRRTYPKNYLATFPGVPGSAVSTIIVGQAEKTSTKTSTPWVVTLLHEHFHQLQDSQPNFYTDVLALGLAKGDQTGMWMLNYAFPYDRKEVQEQFESMSKLLADAVQAKPKERNQKARAYLEGRRKFDAMLSTDDQKYLAFQFWKEGIARYTEYQIARLASAQFKASKEFQALKDYRPFADIAQSTYDRIFNQLLTQKLGESKRDVVYSFGAAEGLLLDNIKPGWRRQYFPHKFDLRKQFERTAK